MFKDLCFYKKNANDVISRMNKMYDDVLLGRRGNLIFRVLLPEDIQVYSSINLDEYDFNNLKNINRYVQKLLEEYEKSFYARRDIEDDALPVLSPVLGIGDYSAFLGGDIVFGNETSWGRPILHKINDWKKLIPIGSAVWYNRFLYICEQIIILSKESGIPFSRGFFSPLDLAGALRGEEIYLDFYDSPEELHGLLEFCAQATISFAEDLYAIAGKHLKGTKYGMWYLDGNINMSEDIACMISAGMYREFAAPYTQKVIDHFGRGHMHTHSRAMYLVKEICKLKNVVNLWLATDPNQPRPIDNIEMLVNDSNGVCIAIDCESFREIEDNHEKLKQGNFSICLPVSSISDAEYLTLKFRGLNT